LLTNKHTKSAFGLEKSTFLSFLRKTASDTQQNKTFLNAILLIKENTVFLIYPSDRYTSTISPKNSGEKKAAPEASLGEFY